MNTTDAIRADAAEEEKRAREVEEAIRKADDIEGATNATTARMIRAPNMKSGQAGSTSTNS